MRNKERQFRPYWDNEHRMYSESHAYQRYVWKMRQSGMIFADIGAVMGYTGVNAKAVSDRWGKWLENYPSIESGYRVGDPYLEFKNHYDEVMGN